MTNDIDSLGWFEADKHHHFHPLTNPVALKENGPDMVTRAEGIYVYLNDGRRIMDTGSGLWNVNIGYGNRRVCEAAFQAMQELSYGHAILGRSNPWAAALSKKLVEITPRPYQCFFFASSGSEANESAVKLALHYWRLRGKAGKRGVIARRRSYHGNTIYTASLTGQELFHTQFGLPLSGLVHHTDSTHWYLDGKGRSKEEFYRDILVSLEKQILQIGPENIAAFIGEPIQTGMLVPHETYWPTIRRLCDQYEILLIADEVVSGFGKTGRMFGFENFGIEPDLFATAKGLTSGYFPMSTVGISRTIAEVLQSDNKVFAHVFTNSGHPVGAAVALANLAVIEEQQLVDKVRTEIGPHFSQRLNDLLRSPCVGEVRSLGVMGAFDVDASGGARTSSQEENDGLLDKIVAVAWRRGIMVRGGGLCLPMIMTRQQIDEAMDILEESITEAWSATSEAAAA